MTTTIRPCTLEDLHLLKDISYDTFYETFKDQNKPENLQNYLKEAFTIEKLEREFNQPHSQFYFIYLNETELAGYLKVNMYDAQSEEMGDESFEIERIYVKKEYQKHGLGKLLFQKALDIAKENNKQKLWLGVWEKNENAIAFYQKFGFTKVGEHTFHMGDEEQVDFIMSKDI
ncbi:GNAT family N-acetyltransferase [Ornithinibacillus sp. 4-3]|uniref:GNAT family N-acetyltransferase n=1 Tax=Ornithinibacillus sp. 4-3 TaxID=3231488 RepID=A0AB39HSG0_9BACI